MLPSDLSATKASAPASGTGVRVEADDQGQQTPASGLEDRAPSVHGAANPLGGQLKLRFLAPAVEAQRLRVGALHLASARATGARNLLCLRLRLRLCLRRWRIGQRQQQARACTRRTIVRGPTTAGNRGTAAAQGDSREGRHDVRAVAARRRRRRLGTTSVPIAAARRPLLDASAQVLQLLVVGQGRARALPLLESQCRLPSALDGRSAGVHRRDRGGGRGGADVRSGRRRGARAAAEEAEHPPPHTQQLLLQLQGPSIGLRQLPQGHGCGDHQLQQHRRQRVGAEQRGVDHGHELGGAGDGAGR
mmetsp:Transcript_177628/g.563553  ORF Transcript_177628/g.563553 Transcript_177628/m.563553 type:complete len:305 (+) Transcript_177628:925-1839(+)